MNGNLLSLVLFLPVLGALVLLAIPRERKAAIRLWANVTALAGFLVSVPLYLRFQPDADGFQFVEKVPWVPAIGVQYFIGIDGISLLLVLLTCLVGWLAILSSWSAIQHQTKEYYALLLLLQTGMIGVFVSLDAVLFYVFWEVVLIPMYFLIASWGGARRQYAAMKFFLYTLAGSVLMLIGFLTLYFQHYFESGVYSFAIPELTQVHLLPHLEAFVFLSFFLAFAIKVPMVPFHTWLPDAHTEAPTAGSVVLAAVLLKMGTYGFLRLGLPLFSGVWSDWYVVRFFMLGSIVGILYGGFICLVQQDWKRLVAYSSVSHMGLCTLGLFALSPNAVAGSVLQQINHGISTGMLFLIVGIIYERRHTREISEYGGLAHVMPKFAFAFAFASFSSAGLPLLNGFIGEFTILAGVADEHIRWAAMAVPGIILGAAYLLLLFQKTMLGPITKRENLALADLRPREVLVLAPLALAALWIGLYPQPFFRILEKPVYSLIERANPGYFDVSTLRGGPR